MSDTLRPQVPTVAVPAVAPEPVTLTPRAPPQPSGTGSITFAAAAVGVGNWVLTQRYGIAIPGDVAMYIGVLLTGAAHVAQMMFLAWRGSRAPSKS